MISYSVMMELLNEVERKLVFVLGKPTTSVWVRDTLGPVTQKVTQALDEEWCPGPTDLESEG